MKQTYTQAEVIVAIQKLLRDKQVGTHEEIRLALEKKGYVVNQVKISRLLHKIGAIKMIENSNIVYRLPTELVTISPKDTLRQLVLSISHNATLIVIQTTPGAAQLVARLLDRENTPDILGTIAGDDTIFVAPKTIKQIERLAKDLYNFLLG